MFLENLKQLMAWGEHPAPTVTEEELQKKEAELQVTLPEAVRQLYLTVSPGDPLFVDCRMLPIEEWMTRTVEDVFGAYQALPILVAEKIAIGPALSVESKNYILTGGTCIHPDWEMDGEAYGLTFKSKFPKRNPQKPIPLQKYASMLPISQILLALLASQIAKSSKSIIIGVTIESPYKEQKWMEDAFSPLNDQKELCKYKKDPSVWGLKSPEYIRFSFGLCEYYYWVLWADSDEPLEQIISESGIFFEWIKSQNGNVTPEKKVPAKEPKEIPEDRSLLSIAPVLKYIHDFAGLTGTYTTKEQIEKAEKRFGQELPLPLKEFYQYLPKEYFGNYDTIRDMSRMRKRKDGKVVFLEENQYVFLGAAKLGGSYIYRQYTDDEEGIWEVSGILDGYLAVEFLNNILKDHLPGLVMEEWSAKEIKPIKDHITPFFTELAGISSKIAVGNITQLYDVCNGEGIAAYTEADGTLLLYTKEEDNLIALERKLGLIKE